MTQNSTTEKGKRPKWVRGFLAHLELTGNISRSCVAAKIDRREVYRLRDSDAEFAESWDSAIEHASALLEEEARRRAYSGVNKPVIHKGELMGAWLDSNNQQVAPNTPGARLVPLTVVEYSDTLLIFLLKGALPNKYCERVEVGGAGKGGEIVVKVLGNVSMADL